MYLDELSSVMLMQKTYYYEVTGKICKLECCHLGSNYQTTNRIIGIPCTEPYRYSFLSYRVSYWNTCMHQHTHTHTCISHPIKGQHGSSVTWGARDAWLSAPQFTVVTCLLFHHQPTLHVNLSSPTLIRNQ